MSGIALIVIGTSWGGLEALSVIVRGLPGSFPIPLVAVQHRSRDARPMLAELLQQNTELTVSEAEDKDFLSPGRLLLAPPDYHLLIEDSFISLDTDQQVKYSRPSIDVTLISAAETYGARVAGLVLTGANDDGAAGLRRIADRGGVALVEDPTTATSAAMPAAALRAVPQARVLALADIPAALVRLADEPIRRRA
ncbi:MAG TPA: chemotaxis protein CheB [Gemmatimonadaceae bacterium]|nr:chemotaxis protein CheB [Gemmatimonadaceae bacterium]